MRLLRVPTITDSVHIYLLQTLKNIIRYNSSLNLYTATTFHKHDYNPLMPCFSLKAEKINTLADVQLSALGKSAGMCAGVY